MYAPTMGRRRFIRQAGLCGLAGVATLGGLVTWSGCGSKQKAAEAGAQAHNAVKAARQAADPCNDPTTLTEAELTTRKTLAYEPRSSDATKLCQNCQFWQPAAKEEPCGTCALVKGPIHPLGRCLSWVEKKTT